MHVAADSRDSTEAALRATVEVLERLERAPCSAGEREAAEWIAARLREAGLPARVERDRVHGSFEWPLGSLAALGAAGGVAALAGRRRIALATGAAAAAAMWQDLGGGRRRWFRRLLPQAETSNVVAEAGDAGAERTLVVLAHHDAARTSFVFDQALPRLLFRRLPWLVSRLDRWPPLMALVVGGPALVAAGAAAGSRRVAAAGTLLAACTVAVMADMVTNEVVPGANDNLSAVAVLLELARELVEHPPRDLRVVLLSAGAEEANQEGMLAFARRHLADLPPETTCFLCLDTVGSPQLVLIEGEGFLRMRDYSERFKRLVADAAAGVGVALRRGLRFTFATDGLVPLRAGYDVAAVGSVNDYLVPSNYHWPSDTADRVDYRSVAAALRLTERVVRRLEEGPPGA